MSIYKVLVIDEEIEVEVTYYYGGCSAKLNALPEDCYPEEGEEIDWKYCDSVSEFKQQAIEANEKWQDEITEQLSELIPLSLEDDRY